MRRRAPEGPGRQICRHAGQKVSELLQGTPFQNAGRVFRVSADEAVDQAQHVLVHVRSNSLIDTLRLKMDAGTETRPSSDSSSTAVAVVSTISPCTSPIRTLWPTL